MTDGELFAAACQALWGANWRGDAEREFSVRKSTVSEWSRGKGAKIPAGVWQQLGKLVADRQTALNFLARAIAQRANGPEFDPTGGDDGMQTEIGEPRRGR